ncbi:MAG: HAMP domain-containing sensor histidine kinase [Alphaproteobacteria bacterium]|mgnify:CR=1 FL=1
MVDIATRSQHLWRSLGAKLIALVVIFFAVPVILYDQFQAADREKRALLLKLVQDQGRVLAESLRPRLETFDWRSNPGKATQLLPFHETGLHVRLLFRPIGETGARNFFYVASTPAVSTESLEQDRAELLHAGVLDKLGDSCEGGTSLATRYLSPASEAEILTSVTPLTTKFGCWAVITSRGADDILGLSITESYWSRPEVKVAAIIYVAMALVVLWVFLSVWQSLRRFAHLARSIRASEAPSASFSAQNRVPELDNVAQEFDDMVDTLHGSALAIRNAAEENAHAFKTPIGVIRQALEPLKRPEATADPRTRRAIDLIERAIERLDALVAAARRIDEATAALIHPPREIVRLSDLTERVVEDYREVATARGVRLTAQIEPMLSVQGGEEIVETVVENILDNAIGFSYPGQEVRVRLAREGRTAHLVVADAGPGVASENLERIFDRYFSKRPVPRRDGEAMNGGDGSAHFGIGLWLVRRNVEAIGGSARAENRAHGGLEVHVRLPLLMAGEIEHGSFIKARSWNRNDAKRI